jgi:Uma2 family endonuclease
MTLVGFPPVSDAVLMRLGEMNPGWSFERDDEGAIEVSPTSWKSGGSSVRAVVQLTAWADGNGGGRAFDSSTGFRLSTDAVRCPDAAWVSQERLESARSTHPNDFFPGAPDIAIEIASPSDVWARVTAKIEMYMREGTTYAVAIDVQGGRVYETGTPPPGLALDFDAIREAGS